MANIVWGRTAAWTGFYKKHSGLRLIYLYFKTFFLEILAGWAQGTIKFILSRCDDEMTSLRFHDGGCAAMTPAKCKAVHASAVSFRHHAAQRRIHCVIRQELTFGTRNGMNWKWNHRR